MEIRYATISKTDRRHNNEDAFKAIDISVQMGELLQQIKYILWQKVL